LQSFLNKFDNIDNLYKILKFITLTKLSVNINKVAVLRNSRGGAVPNVLQVAKDCESFGADGITVHPRPDERHITTQDVYDLSKVVTTEFNIEGYPDDRYLQLIKEVKPAQATLVPDPPNVLTSNAGWDTIKHHEFLTDIISEIKKYAGRVSVFLFPNEEDVQGAKNVGADRIEFYTGSYASQYHNDKVSAIAPYIKAAEIADKLDMGINAGHDLDLYNLEYLSSKIPTLAEVSIGHALISDALYLGLENTIQLYKSKLKIT